jgi:benzoyl-CoA reductase/2-hydroxyglutaryl-CoA dehydratase subunit BcrC/BadD/HgdB
MKMDAIHKFMSSEEERMTDDGGGAGYFCRQFSPEILAGFGYRPIRICSADQESAKEGERHVRPDICARCKDIIGGIKLGKYPYSKLSLIATLDTCDMMRRTLDLISDGLGIPVFRIHHPSTRSGNARKFFVSEIACLIENISARTGRVFDPEKALCFSAARRECARILRELSIQGETSQSIIHPLSELFNFANPQRLLGFIKEIRAQIPQRRIKGMIIFAGSPFMQDAVKISDIIEVNGFGVLNLTCAGLDQFNAIVGSKYPIRNGRNVVAKFAKACFDAPPCIRTRPNHEVHRRIGEWIKDIGASGMIYRTFKFCDLWSVERIRFRNSIGIPMLSLDSDGQGQINEAIRTRVDAFLETIEVNRGKN